VIWNLRWEEIEGADTERKGKTIDELKTKIYLLGEKESLQNLRSVGKERGSDCGIEAFD